MKKLEFGYKCKDIITGFEGIITGKMIHITGCDRLGITNDKDEQKFFNEPTVRFIDEGIHKELYESVGCNEINDVYDAKFGFGVKAKDKINGYIGTIIVKWIGVTGDISYAITPEFNPLNRSNDAEWVDEGRIEVIESKKPDIKVNEKRTGGIAKPSGMGICR